MKLLILCILVAFATAAPKDDAAAPEVPGDSRRVAQSCERSGVEPNAEPLRISCDAGRVILVRNTFYGRRKPSKIVCPYSRPHIDDTTCLGNPENDRLIVGGLCDGKNSCEVVATNQLFGDPCVGTYKYLQVHYSCLKA